jgi:S1-C subfamily serine protease
VWAVLAFFPCRSVVRWLAGTGALLLAVVSGVGSAEEVPRSRAQIALSFAPVVRTAAPAVVNIYGLKGRAADPLLSDPFFRFFFQDFGARPLPRSVPENSLGSGVIVAADSFLREHPLLWRLEVERAEQRLAVVIGE